MSTIRVVARGKARQGQEGAVRDLMSQLVEPTRREQGCISYQLFESTTDPTDFVMLEEWASDAAIDEHLRQKNVVAILTKLGPLFAGPPEIARFKLVR